MRHSASAHRTTGRGLLYLCLAMALYGCAGGPEKKPPVTPPTAEIPVTPPPASGIDLSLPPSQFSTEFAAAEQAPGRRHGAFEPQVQLGIGQHPVLAVRAVAAAATGTTTKGSKGRPRGPCC